MAIGKVERRISIAQALREKSNVMKAVMLRDLRTRFFNHGLGFLIVSLWPLGHMVILLVIYTGVGRKAPYGDSLNVFFATGLIPTLLFMYVSRFMSVSLLMNKAMLSFPAVKVVDIMMARALLEAIAAFVTLVLLFAVLWAVGDDPLPVDPYQAVYAYMAALLLAIGVGTVAGVITILMPFFPTIYALTMILVYITSGTLFVVSALPGQISYALSWNPVVHAVEWMRLAYYPGYSDSIIDRQYLIGFGLGSLLLGLAVERAIRMKMLEG